jgi:hypothetical protein
MKRNSFNVGEVHSFSRKLAQTHGINAAILMAFLANRIPAVQTARNDNRGYYTSVKKLAQHYPYLTPSIISYTLSQLRINGVLNAERHNRKAYDKTLWYSFDDPAIQKQAGEDPIRFNVEAAKRFGVEAALILANLNYWIKDNQKKDNSYEWHRVSPNELAEHLPLSERTIRRALQKMSEGEDRVLERKRGTGFDQAFSYRILNPEKGGLSDKARPEYEISDQNTEMDRPISCWPDPKNDRPESNNHCPESQQDRPNQDIHRPEPSTYTHYEDNIEKTTFVKNDCEKHIQDTLAAPSVSVCVSHTLDAAESNPTNVTSLAPSHSISASGINSGQGAVQDALPSKPALVSKVTASVTPASPVSANSGNPKLNPFISGSFTSVKEPSSKPVNESSLSLIFESDKDRQMRQMRERQAEYDERCVKFASPYAYAEEDANLSAEHKMRVFRAGIQSMMKLGRNIIYSGKSFKSAQKFFELNPGKTARSLLSALEGCLCHIDLLIPIDEGEYDECFYIRRSNNLDFFFKYLGFLMNQIEMPEIADAILSDEDKEPFDIPKPNYMPGQAAECPAASTTQY